MTLPSKQVVAGSSPVSRSTKPDATTCLPRKSLPAQLARYRLDARSRGYSEATITHTEMSVAAFGAFLGGIDDVGAVTGDDLRRYIVLLRGTPRRHLGAPTRGLSPTSVNTYVRAVRSFWGWLRRSQAIADNPLAHVPAPRYPRKVARVYTDEQLRAVLRHAAQKPRERAMVELFLDSGIRLSELSLLTVDDIDLAQGSVRVMGKGAKERYSYFSPMTALSLRDYLDQRPEPRDGDYLFVTNTGFRLRQRAIQSGLVRLGRAAGLATRLSPHTLRHTYATLSLRNGNNLEYVRLTLGHTNIKTTSDAYLAASQADLAQAHRRFSPLANLNRKRRA